MTWGSGGARLGHGSGAVLKPTVVPGVENCIKLACSSTQTAVLTGRISFPPMNSSNNGCVAERQLIVFDDTNGRANIDASHCGEIVNIYCGNGVTAVRNAENSVYFAGKFMKKSFGLDSPVAGEFKAVSFGAEHCLLLTTEGTVMSLGSNSSGQLGMMVL